MLGLSLSPSLDSLKVEKSTEEREREREKCVPEVSNTLELSFPDHYKKIPFPTEEQDSLVFFLSLSLLILLFLTLLNQLKKRINGRERKNGRIRINGFLYFLSATSSLSDIRKSNPLEERIHTSMTSSFFLSLCSFFQFPSNASFK